MNCSYVYFAVSGNGSLSVVGIDFDCEDLFHHLEGDMSKVFKGMKQVFEPDLLFNEFGNGYSCKSEFVSQIVLCDALLEEDIVPVTYAVVGYNYNSFPTDFEIVCEVGRILAELGV